MTQHVACDLVSVPPLTFIGFTYIAFRGNARALAIWILAWARAGSHADSADPTRVVPEPKMATVVVVVSINMLGVRFRKFRCLDCHCLSNRIRDHTRSAHPWSAFCPLSSLLLANIVVHSAYVPSVSVSILTGPTRHRSKLKLQR